MVPKKGLEPPHPCEYMDLNHARLPIPPLRHCVAPGKHRRCDGKYFIYSKGFVECVKPGEPSKKMAPVVFTRTGAQVKLVHPARSMHSKGRRALEQLAGRVPGIHS